MRRWSDGVNYILSASPFFKLYADLVERYASRKVSHGSDALNAIYGLLSALYSISDEPELVGPLLYGMPQNFLDLALLWQPNEGSAVRLQRSATRKSPSWSWAAWTMLPTVGHCEFEAGVRFDRQGGPQSIKPLVCWHRLLVKTLTNGDLSRELLAINDTGIGLPLVTEFANDVKAKNQLVDRIRMSSICTEDLDARLLDMLDDRHLIFKTGWARLRVESVLRPRTETLWRSKDGYDRPTADSELILMETHILSSNGSNGKIGQVLLPAPVELLGLGEVNKVDQQWLCDFILISEERSKQYNVMLIRWLDNDKGLAERLALGRVEKTAWDAEKAEQRIIVLE